MTDRAPAWTGYAILGVAGVLMVGLLALAPRGEAPEDTRALQRFLSQMGLEVSESDSPPDAGTFVLLQDLRTPEEVLELLRWVTEGGRLVVTSESGVASEVGVLAGRPVSLFGEETLEPACVTPEAVGVRRIAVRASGLLLAAPSVSGVACFRKDDGAFMMIIGHGAGTVVVLGGASPWTNELLGDEDNAALAFQVMGSGPQVVFGPPIPPQAGAPTWSVLEVWGVLPDPARAALAGAALAGVAFVLVRGRRLGRPVLEEPMTPIPASELVRATARLYRNGRALAFAARLTREWTASGLAHRMGFPGSDAVDLVARVGEAAGLPEDAVRRVLDGPDPVSDDDLIRLGRDLEDLKMRVGRIGGVPRRDRPDGSLERGTAPNGPGVTTR